MSNCDLAIIGAGPAGLAAANYAINAHLNAVLIAPDLGGKVNYGFALRNQPAMDSVWGAELVHQFAEYMAAHEDRHLRERISNVVREESGLFRLTLIGAEDVEHSVRARSIIVATGAQPQQLHIPGEKEYWGRGLSYSAVSHASFFEDRDVVVVGRGSRAVVAALELATLARQVYFVPTLSLDAADLRTAQVRNHPRITVLDGWELIQVSGDEFVTGATVVSGYEKQVLDVEGIFIELGLLPNKEFLRGVVEFDPETGRIPVNNRCETGVAGLFAAGDVTDIFAEQVPVAVGEGIKAAISAWEYLALHDL